MPLPKNTWAEPASPASSTPESLTPDEESKALREEGAKRDAERKIIESELKSLRAQAEIAKLTPQTAHETEFDHELSRLVRIRQLKELQEPSQPQNTGLSAETLFNAFARGVEAARGTATPNGSSSSSKILEVLATKALNPPDPLQQLSFFLERGIVRPMSGDAPQSELAARAALSLRKMELEDARELRKGEQEGKTMDRLLVLAQEAERTIAGPIAAAVGNAMSNSRVGGQAAAPSPDPAEQVRALGNLIERASRAKEEAMARMGQAPANPSSPIPDGMPPTPIMSTPMPSMTPTFMPVSATEAIGSVFSRKEPT